MVERVSVCLPVYNGAGTILETIGSILSQTFKDFELVIVDNASTDETIDLVRSIRDHRIKLYSNDKNLGCGGNLEACKNKATGDILFYVCADDILDVDAVRRVSEAFKISEDIGVVVRPYYWFDEYASVPVRMTKQFNETQIISIADSYKKVRDVIALSDQISGIGLRRRYMNSSFKNEHFVEMASMVAFMLKTCKAIILKDNIVAIRISKSGALNPLAYKKSPMLAWYDLMEAAYNEDRFRGLRNYLISNFIATNYVGLAQIKNFGNYKALFREIYYLIKLRRINIIGPRFWIFAIGSIIIPRAILRKLVVFYKDQLNSRFLKNISIKTREET